MGAMVTVLVTAAGLVVLGVREVQEMRARRAGRRRQGVQAAHNPGFPTAGSRGTTLGPSPSSECFGRIQPRLVVAIACLYSVIRAHSRLTSRCGHRHG